MNMIFVDMDGVLCDFVGASLRTHGIAINLDDEWPQGVTYDFWGDFGLTDEEFWKPINDAGAEWWAELPQFDWTPELLATIQRFASNEDYGVAISTSPSRNGASALGKTQWMQKNYPALARRMMIGPHKHWLAASGRILIDDSDSQCERFRKAGGYPILFPQPWNSKGVRQCRVADVSDYLASFASAA